jgi:hypothetical protein
MTSIKGSFTPIHCLLLTLNGFIGPDIGSFTDQAMIWIHHSLQYIMLIASEVQNLPLERSNLRLRGNFLADFNG